MSDCVRPEQKIQLLTAQECYELHDLPRERAEKARQKKYEEERKQYELQLPRLIDEYIDYLAACQRKEGLPISLDKSPPEFMIYDTFEGYVDVAFKTINERLKPYGLILAKFYVNNRFPRSPICHSLNKI